jgi:putative NIF3 family GTP cyclohydrolase 1 type 2
VTGWMRSACRCLLAHDINLFAYHLPLDAHPNWATTRSWARVLGLRSRPAGLATRSWALSVPACGLDGAQAGGWTMFAIGARPAGDAGQSCGNVLSAHSMVHGRCAGLFRGSHRCRRRRVHHRRNLRAPGALMRASRAWPSWPAGTTPPSAMGHLPSRPMWPRQPGHGPSVHRHRQPRMKPRCRTIWPSPLGDPAGLALKSWPRPFAMRPMRQRGCLVVGGSGQALRRAAPCIVGTRIPLPVAVSTDLARLENVPPRCIPVHATAGSGAVLPPWGRSVRCGRRMAGRGVVWAARPPCMAGLAAW